MPVWTGPTSLSPFSGVPKRVFHNRQATHMQHSPAAPAPADTNTNGTPTHIAIIMDGNGRWASERGLARTDGHRAGTEVARRTVEECRTLGVKNLTLYTFSRENWSRPAEEVRFLFELMVDFITRELPNLLKQGIRMRILGDAQALPFAARKTLTHACSRTEKCQDMVLNLALNYSGQEEILRACREYMQAGGKPGDLTPEVFRQYLYTAGQPDPDLVIRTSGELRISNFLLFQSAYSEFYFTDVLWPDFTPQELHKAIADFKTRSRRFGAVNSKPTSVRA